MSLIGLVQKIQKQPRIVRVWVLWSLVFVCMSIIGGGWVFSLKYSIGGKQTASIGDEISSRIPSLKDTFKDSVGIFFEKKEEENKNTEENVFFEKKSKPLAPAKLPLRP